MLCKYGFILHLQDNLRVLFKQFGTIENIYIATPAADSKYTYG